MKLSVRTSLLIRFGILVLLTIIATYIGFLGLRRLNNANDHLYHYRASSAGVGRHQPEPV